MFSDFIAFVCDALSANTVSRIAVTQLLGVFFMATTYFTFLVSVLDFCFSCKIKFIAKRTEKIGVICY